MPGLLCAKATSRELLVVVSDLDALAAVRVAWAIRFLVAVFLDLSQHLLDRNVQLRIVASSHLRRVIDDFNVRIDTVPFNAPRSVFFINADTF